MSNIQFSGEELAGLIQFYKQQHADLLQKVKHVEGMLAKLGGSVPAEPTSASVSVRESAPAAKAPRAARTRRAKRGKPAIWADIVLKALKKFDRPLRYEDLYHEAIIAGNIDINEEGKEKKLKEAVNQSIFRLRNVNKKISSVRVENQKGTFLALNKWLDEEGNLQEQYAKRVF
jgi:hypothetical protein